MKLAVFYHIYQDNKWLDIFNEQILALQNSGLYDALSYLHLGVSGDKYVPHLDKTTNLVRNYNTASEADTLFDLWKFCQAHKDAKVLYLHTKGAGNTTYAGRDVTHEVALWRKFMQFYMIDHWKVSVGTLDHFDTIGSDWRHDATIGGITDNAPHYPGNFWWANASYITRLDPKYLYNEVHPGWIRWQSEFWIGTCLPNCGYFHDSGYRDKYNQPTYPEEYINRWSQNGAS